MIARQKLQNLHRFGELLVLIARQIYVDLLKDINFNLVWKSSLAGNRKSIY